jgi:hypothetical protein
MRRAFSSLTAVTLRVPGFLAPGAGVGLFSGWNSTIHPLFRTTTGDWTITSYLPPGRVIYHERTCRTEYSDPRALRIRPSSCGSSRGDVDGAA